MLDHIQFLSGMLELDENFLITNFKLSESEIHIFIEQKKREQICPKCNSKVNRINDYYIQKVKDLKICQRETYLHFRKKRYRCKCGKTFFEENSLLNKRQRMTKRMFSEILRSLEKEHSFSSVGKTFGVSVNTVIRAFDRLQYPKADLENTEVLSIDEFKGNTGGEKYNCIIVDAKRKVVLDILPKRYSAYLTSYFANIRKENRKNVKCFVSDMWKTYQDMSEVFFKNAKFIVDKYHWIRQVIWSFESVRKEEQKKFYKLFRVYFKRSKRLLIKRFNFLSDDEKQQVNIMLYKSENIRIAHTLKEEFLKILDCKDRKEAKELLSEWIMFAQNSRLKVFEKCADTMTNWSTGILNSFDEPYTNGFIEGCNNKIKVLKRNAYGYRNFERFRNRIIHIFQHKHS